jgi:GABA(A) receptor-associated protein
MAATVAYAHMQRYTFEQRASESARIRDAYPGRVPVICERSDVCSTVPRIGRSKYLVPLDLTFGQFFHVVRSKVKVPPATALFFYVGNDMPATSCLVSELYESHKNEDGFLYLTYAGENTFGG